MKTTIGRSIQEKHSNIYFLTAFGVHGLPQWRPGHPLTSRLMTFPSTHVRVPVPALAPVRVRVWETGRERERERHGHPANCGCAFAHGGSDLDAVVTPQAL